MIAPLKVKRLYRIWEYNQGKYMWIYWELIINIKQSKLKPWAYFGMGTENMRRRYNVTSSLILWAHSHIVPFQCGRSTIPAGPLIQVPCTLKTSAKWTAVLISFAHLKILKLVIYDFSKIHSLSLLEIEMTHFVNNLIYRQCIPHCQQQNKVHGCEWSGDASTLSH